MEKWKLVMGLLFLAFTPSKAQQGIQGCKPCPQQKSGSKVWCSGDRWFMTKCLFDCAKETDPSLGPGEECELDQDRCMKGCEAQLRRDKKHPHYTEGEKELCSKDGEKYETFCHHVCDKADLKNIHFEESRLKGLKVECDSVKSGCDGTSKPGFLLLTLAVILCHLMQQI